MKTNTFVFFSSILLVLVYFLTWQIKPFEYGDTSEFFPATALLYVEQKNVSDFLDDVESSKLGKAIQSIKFLKIGRELELEKEKIALIQNINSLIKDNWSNEVIRELFGQKIALALLQPQNSINHSDINEFLKASTVLVAQPKHKAELLQIMAERYVALKENISISTHQYGAHHIKRIKTERTQFSVVVLNGLYFISFEEKQLRRCIDTFDAEIPSLIERAEYIALRDNYSDPDQFLYLSLKNSREFVRNGLLTYEFSVKDIVEKEVAATVGFDGISYGAWKNENLIKDRIMILHNDKIANNFVENQLRLPPSICETMKFSPPKPLVFYWTNVLNFGSLYEYYNKKSAESDNKLAVLSKTLQLQSGETIEQLLSYLGQEFSYIITASHDSNFLSIPYGLMLIEIKNREKLETTLEKLISRYDFPFKEQKHGTTSFYSWENSPQDGLEPLYGFLDNYLFIGNSRSLLKKVIDRRKEGDSLLKDPEFIEVDGGLTKANNYVSYTNNAELIKIFKSLLTLSSTVIAIEDKEAAKRVSILTKDVINPLLNGLSMFARTATRSYFTENSVTIDSMTMVVD